MLFFYLMILILIFQIIYIFHTAIFLELEYFLTHFFFVKLNLFVWCVVYLSDRNLFEKTKGRLVDYLKAVIFLGDYDQALIYLV